MKIGSRRIQPGGYIHWYGEYYYIPGGILEHFVGQRAVVVAAPGADPLIGLQFEDRDTEMYQSEPVDVLVKLKPSPSS